MNMSDIERAEYRALQKAANEAYTRHVNNMESESLFLAFKHANIALRAFEEDFGIY